MIKGVKLMTKNSIFKFSSVSVSQNNFLNLQEILKNKKQQINDGFEDYKIAKQSQKQAYVHPYDYPESPITLSSDRTQELINDFLGPEQVSAHNEKFGRTRKYLLGFLTTYAALGYFINYGGLDLVALSVQSTVLVNFLLFYFFIEGKKYMFMPIQLKWYNEVNQMEIDNIERGFIDDKGEYANNAVEKAKEQLEYYYLHQDFEQIKYESVSRFLVNEELRAKNNLKERSQNLLQQAKEFENKNESKMIQEILQVAMQELSDIKNQVPDDVFKASFESALDGIENGYADFKKDIVLDRIKNKIEEKVKKFQNQSPEQIKKLISLTNDQIQQLRSMDENAKNQFLSQKINLDQGVKNMESVIEKLKNW